MAKTLNLDELEHLRQQLQKAIDEHKAGEYVFTATQSYRMEICTECKGTAHDYGCSCDDDS